MGEDDDDDDDDREEERRRRRKTTTTTKKEENLLRVSRDERTERSVRGRIRRGGREMQEISGSALGVFTKGRI